MQSSLPGQDWVVSEKGLYFQTVVCFVFFFFSGNHKVLKQEKSVGFSQSSIQVLGLLWGSSEEKRQLAR